MKKRNIFMLIIFIGTVLEIFFHDFLFDNFPGLFSFIFLVPFYFIVYLYYNRYKYIKLMALTGIFNVLSYTFLAYYIPLLGYYHRKVILIARTNTYGSLILFVFLFIALLQDKPKSKPIKYSFIFIVLTTFLLHSFYRYSLNYLLSSIFGPEASSINLTIYIIGVVAIISKVVIMLFQLLIIYKLDKNDEFLLNQPVI